MADTKDGIRILRSWKEIASYLGYDERTCARWEKTLGLPVHRASGLKSRVYVRQDELDAWVARAFPGTAAHAATAPVPAVAPVPAARPSRGAAILLVPALIVLAVLLAVLRGLFPPKGEPADFRFEDSRLVALDAGGHRLWTFETSRTDLVPEAEYRLHFQVRNTAAEWVLLPFLKFADLDGDGRKEALFSVQTIDDSREGILICLDEKGRELWRSDVGRALTFGMRNFTSDYRITGVEAEDLTGDGKPEIVVAAMHMPEWPNRLAVLDPADGRVVSEWWHSGHILEMVFPDLNGDGRKEIAVTGVDNETGGAFLAVLDPLKMTGASPNTGMYRCRDCGPGREIAYIRLPRTEMDRLPRDDGRLPLFESGRMIVPRKDGGLMLTVQLSGIVFDFGPGLVLDRAIISTTFENLYRDQASLGRVPPVLDKARYERELGAGVQWWTGTAWSRDPAPLRFAR